MFDDTFDAPLSPDALSDAFLEFFNAEGVPPAVNAYIDSTRVSFPFPGMSSGSPIDLTGQYIPYDLGNAAGISPGLDVTSGSSSTLDFQPQPLAAYYLDVGTLPHPPGETSSAPFDFDLEGQNVAYDLEAALLALVSDDGAAFSHPHAEQSESFPGFESTPPLEDLAAPEPAPAARKSPKSSKARKPSRTTSAASSSSTTSGGRVARAPRAPRPAPYPSPSPSTASSSPSFPLADLPTGPILVRRNLKHGKTEITQAECDAFVAARPDLDAACPVRECHDGLGQKPTRHLESHVPWGPACPLCGVGISRNDKVTWKRHLREKCKARAAARRALALAS